MTLSVNETIARVPNDMNTAIIVYAMKKQASSE